MADEKDPKLIELRMVDAIEGLQRTAIVQHPSDPETRCREMILTLECYLKGPRTPAGEAMVNRMWDARVNVPRERARIEAVARAVRIANETLVGDDGVEHVEYARSTFGSMLEERCPELIAAITPELQPLVDDAIRGWGRKRGAPKTKDRGPRKHASLAALLEALGFDGPIDPSALKSELSPSRGKRKKPKVAAPPPTPPAEPEPPELEEEAPPEPEEYSRLVKSADPHTHTDKGRT